MLDAQALAILSEKAGLNDNGKIPDDPQRRPAEQWAYERAQYRHGWVVCGLESLKRAVEKDIRSGAIYLSCKS
jgi:hypothetical protein